MVVHKAGYETKVRQTEHAASGRRADAGTMRRSGYKCCRRICSGRGQSGCKMLFNCTLQISYCASGKERWAAVEGVFWKEWWPSRL